MGGNVLLEVMKDPEPPGLREKVVIRSLLKVVRCGHRVIDPPQSGGDKVRQNHVNGVMSSGHHQPADTGQAHQEGQPVENDKPPG